MINSFISYCQIELGLAENTLKAYKKDISDLLTFAGDEGIKAEIINDWLQDLSQASQNTRRRKLMSARTFLRYLIEVIGTHDKVELIKLDPIKKAETKSKNISQTDIKMLYSKCETLLELIIIDLLYSTGMRVSELCSLKIENINLKQKYIKIFGKGQCERIVPVTNDCLENLQKYIASLKNDPHLFLMSRYAVYRIIRRLSNNKFSAHDLRHACATHLLDGGMSLTMLQKILGHSSLSTTQVYTFVSEQRKRDIYNTCFRQEPLC